MKTKRQAKVSANFTSLLVAAIVGFYPDLMQGESVTPDLSSVSEGKVWKGSIEAAKPPQKDGQPAVEFDKSGQNVIWLERFDFAEGVNRHNSITSCGLARSVSTPP
jgi:hypothetical protein